MTLPSSFPLSMSQVAAELGKSLPLSLLNPDVVALAGKSGPPVSFSDLLGKSSGFPSTMTAGVGTVDTNNGGYDSELYFSDGSFGSVNPLVVNGFTIGLVATQWATVAANRSLYCGFITPSDPGLQALYITGAGFDGSTPFNTNLAQLLPVNRNVTAYQWTGAAVSARFQNGGTYQLKFVW